MNAVILAGGKSRRLSKDKCSLRFNGKSVLMMIYDELRELFENIYLSCGHPPQDASSPHIHTIEDRFPGKGPLGGIHAGLLESMSPHTFFCACDMPFISGKVVAELQRHAEGYDVVVPRVRGELEPLLAIYGSACITHIQEQIERGDNRIISFYPRIRVNIIPEEELRSIDPELISFFNINTVEDLARAEALAAQAKAWE